MIHAPIRGVDLMLRAVCNFVGTAGLKIEGCRFAEIGDVISIGSDGVSCDQSRVAALAGIAAKRRGGRPNHPATDAAFALIRDRRSRGVSAASERAEARAVSDQLGEQAPGQTKIIAIISEVWLDH